MRTESPGCHAILVIQDTFRREPGRYLVCQDEQWDCRLFPNCRTDPNADQEENQAAILRHLSRELRVSPDSISLTFLCRRVQEKYSVSAEKRKTYRHEYYCAVLTDFPPPLQEDCFVLDGRRYFWMSIPEMERDEMIKTKNADVVGTVKELF